MIEAHFPPLADDPTTQALAVRGLTKKFKENYAVNNLKLDVPRGSIYGIVGPNGAGKTTMISMVAGLLRPTSGHSWVAGFETWEQGQQMKALMGLLADDAPLFERLSGSEMLGYLGGLRGLEPAVVNQRSKELLEALGLSDAGDKQIVDYSSGMTKKIMLAAALLHNPEVLILDEPLESVDPVSGRLIQEILRRYAATGGTVVISSHVMDLVQGLCTHVAIISEGRVLSAGNIDEVRQGQSLTDAFVAHIGGGDLVEGSLGWLGGGHQ